MKRILTILLLTALPFRAGAVKFDKTVHDFGRIPVSEGAVRCSFTVTNDSDTTLLIQSVISSCGCTSVKWTRTVIAPGGSGIIEAEYSNDEGPYPFDKTLTVYTSAEKRPKVLHLRGVSTKK